MSKKTKKVRVVEQIGIMDLAGRLGVHHMTVRRWIRLGYVPASKVGRKYLLVEDAVREALAANPSPKHGIRSGSTIA